MAKVLQLTTPNHFGDCPKCRKNDGHLNIGREHWFHCRKHHVKWHVGSNIFPDWMDETADTWEQNARLLEYCMEIEPFQQWKYPIDEEAFFRSYRSADKITDQNSD